jgi:hypothetical protein
MKKRVSGERLWKYRDLNPGPVALPAMLCHLSYIPNFNNNCELSAI